MPVPTSQKNYYEVLDLDKDASEEAIKVAYKKLALKWHPDRHKDDKEDAQQKFIEINDAYTALLENVHKARRRKRADEKSRADTCCSSSTASSSSSSTPSESGSTSSERSSTSESKTKVTRDSKESDKRPEEKSSRRPDSDKTTKPSSKPSPKRPKTPRPERPREFSDRRSDSSDSSSDEEDKCSVHDHRKSGSNHRKSRHVEEDSYEFVNLSAPLNPLRSPKSGGGLSKDWIFPLRASLKDLYHGATHHYHITRTLKSGKTQRVKIDIKVAPGWKTGSRIRVPNVGNEMKDGSFQDIVFIVEEEPHPQFTRDGNDVYMTVQIPWADSYSRPYSCSSDDSRLDDSDLQEEMAFVKGLDGEEYALPIPRSLVEAADGTRIVGAGMPIRHRGEKVGKGDLVIKWDFIFLETDKAQRSRWHSLKKAMHWRK